MVVIVPEPREIAHVCIIPSHHFQFSLGLGSMPHARFNFLMPHARIGTGADPRTCASALFTRGFQSHKQLKGQQNQGNHVCARISPAAKCAALEQENLAPAQICRLAMTGSMCGSGKSHQRRPRTASEALLQASSACGRFHHVCTRSLPLFQSGRCSEVQQLLI